MNLFDRTDTTKAFLFPDGSSLSFQDFRERIEEKKKDAADHGAINPLPARPEPGFLIEFLASLESGQPIALFNPQWTAKEKADRELQLRKPFHPDLALVLFTSGSSGSPKAVQLSLANIRANTAAVVASLNFDQAREQTLFLPLHYSYGILGQILPALRAGIPTRLEAQFPRLVLEFAQKSPTGMWSGVPSHWETLLRALPPGRQVPGLSHVISAGAPFSVDLRKRLHAAFPNATIYNNYGLTECSPRVLSFSSRHPDFFGDYVGFPVGDFKVRVDSQGELWLAGSQVMLGYLGDPEGTAARIQNGWLRTGDRARVRGDSLVSLDGRLDDLVNVAGERISLIEVENELKKTDGVLDAVVSVREHPVTGAQLVAFVVPANHAAWDPKKVLTALAQRISAQKVPKEYKVLDQLPRLANGKIDRARLLEILKST